MDVQTDWKANLNSIKKDIKKCQETSEDSYLEIGKLLIQARTIYKGHGNWINWLKKNVDFSVRHAQRLIRVAEMLDDATLVSRLNLDFSKAYLLTRLSSKDEIKSFSSTYFKMAGHERLIPISRMSRREFEEAIRQHLESEKNKATAVSSSNNIKTENNVAFSNAKDIFDKRFQTVQKTMHELIQIIEKQKDHSVRGSLIQELQNLWEETLSRLPEGNSESS